MERTLNYKFERRSKDVLDWLKNTVNTQRYRNLNSIVINDLPEHFR